MDNNQFTESVDRFEAFFRTPRNDQLIRFSVSRNTLFGVAFSILIHGLILFIVLPHLQLNKAAPIPSRDIEMQLVENKPPLVKTSKVIPLEKSLSKEIKPRAKLITRNFEHVSKMPSFAVPVVPDNKTPVFEPLVPKESAKVAPTDMMAYVNAKRSQRQASEAEASKQNAEAVVRENGPSESQLREERIKNNFQNGTNGIFEITSLSGRQAGFSFRGWTNDYSHARRESFEVEAKPGQDVRLVMIKKMITLIREHYQGDFNWDSQRLGRVIIQSARPEDNAGLEDFMMMEFFGTNYKNAM